MKDFGGDVSILLFFLGITCGLFLVVKNLDFFVDLFYLWMN